MLAVLKVEKKVALSGSLVERMAENSGRWLGCYLEARTVLQKEN